MEDFIKSVAQQLRKPNGEMGKEIGARMNKGNYEMNCNTIALVAPIAGDRILEIGMGNGFFIKDIVGLNPTIRYTGCDYSELMVAEAAELSNEQVATGQVNLLVGEASALPFPPASFNKVFTVNTIYFWERPAKELAEIHRVLQPGGRLIIAFRPESSMQHLPFTQYGFTLYNVQRLSALLKDAGFAIKSVVENEEPPQEMHGEPMRMDHVLVDTLATNF